MCPVTITATRRTSRTPRVVHRAEGVQLQQTPPAQASMEQPPFRQPHRAKVETDLLDIYLIWRAPISVRLSCVPVATAAITAPPAAANGTATAATADDERRPFWNGPTWMR